MQLPYKLTTAATWRPHVAALPQVRWHWPLGSQGYVEQLAFAPGDSTNDQVGLSTASFHCVLVRNTTLSSVDFPGLSYHR